MLINDRIRKKAGQIRETSVVNRELKHRGITQLVLS